MVNAEEHQRSPERLKESISELAKNISKNGEAFEDESTFVLKQQIIASLQANSDQRRRYARYTFWLTVSWIFVVLVILIPASFYNAFSGKHVLEISDTVLIALLTTTTLNVFGFFLLVMKYLFNTEEWKAISEIFISKSRTG